VKRDCGATTVNSPARCSFFYQRDFALEGAVEFHAFALFEALPCV
jgi:hypothetical protein